MIAAKLIFILAVPIAIYFFMPDQRLDIYSSKFGSDLMQCNHSSGLLEWAHNI
jgi:hypothetical protein